MKGYDKVQAEHTKLKNSKYVSLVTPINHKEKEFTFFVKDTMGAIYHRRFDLNGNRLNYLNAK